MKQNHGLPPANTLSDEKQSAWIAGMKVWEKENPLDKPAEILWCSALPAQSLAPC